MTALIIILLALAPLLFLKIKLHGIYCESNYGLYVEIIGIKVKNLLETKKKKKPGKSSSHKTDKLRIVLKCLDKLKKAILLEKLRIKYIAAACDPFDTVKKYNAANAAVFSVIFIIENSLKIINKEIQIDLDMCAEKSIVESEIKLSISVCKLLNISIFAGIEVLKLLLSRKAEEKGERKALLWKINSEI